MGVMPHPLPRLRFDLDFMPSPVADRPGLLVRDPYNYSDATLIIPPALVAAVQLFDGDHTELDLREFLVRLTGELEVSSIEKNLIETLEGAGFLEGETYQALKQQRHREFAEAPVRPPAHAGSAYPAGLGELNETMRRYMTDAPPQAGEILGIAAPHVSPEGGWQCYREAFAAAAGAQNGKTFVILGTSHYGEPGKFGLTRKPYITPFGASVTDTGLVTRLAAAAGDSVLMEDYCHSFEHTIEFQVLFLQHLFGPQVKVLPILVGSFGRSILAGGRPESEDGVRRFFDALGEIAETERERLFWVLGVDMAHMGERYGDRISMRANQDAMLQVAERDRRRIEQINAGNSEDYWELVRDRGDDLKWCGSAPFYTFLKANPQARGNLLRYQQWNIDEASVVSFAAMSFHA